MDWGQAKNILLVAFLLLNIVLGYKVINDSDLTYLRAQISEEEREEVKQNLEKQNVVFDGDIPDNIFDSQHISVSNYELRVTEVAEAIVDGSFLIDGNDDNSGETRILSHDENMIITQGSSGKLSIRFKEAYLPDSQKQLTKDSEEASRELINNFLKKLNLTDEFSYHGKYRYSKEEITRIHDENENFEWLNDEEELVDMIYYQEFDDHLMYGGYAVITLSPNGIKGAEIYLLQKEGLKEENIEVIPATMALLRLGEYLPSYTEIQRITGITFGYYTEEYTAETWEAVPVWRIEFDTREVYYINAFTGEIEREGVY
ncbi:two-component system regulatory protein YycI [Natranaerobius thermophilus]|uniref:Regulatory protein YycH-like domain-containing protein n=1 Tax=Natranaerobius thermophilus (strain ATCC BAA-1301 / DSM 18059 / JW/NM-WN-LF) TaxID=457570 RepID=B2A441_NATTJ|nr:two-component system regulatory protein YycI [Natranaerobius thermophilus]ACB86447.1 hypothetical protein Nther_2900 [Natranaerobius thermophilus JW/NM-WN-LF]